MKQQQIIELDPYHEMVLLITGDIKFRARTRVRVKVAEGKIFIFLDH